MAKKFIRMVDPDAKLYRDTASGIAWIHDGRSGCGISVHPNIDTSGSIRGMKKLGYWGKDDVCVRAGGFIYNISRYASDWDDTNSRAGMLEQVAADECMCQFCIARRRRDKV